MDVHQVANELPADAAAQPTQVTSPPHPVDRKVRPEARLGGTALALARVGWVTVALLSLGFSVWLVWLQYQRIATLSFLPDAIQRQNARVGLTQLGLSTDFLATYFVINYILSTAVYFAIGTAIFFARSYLRQALLVSLFLITYWVGRSLVVFPEGNGWALPLGIVATIAYASFIILYMSWDGHFDLAWTRYLAAAWVILMALANILPDSPLSLRYWGNYFNLVAVPIILGAGVLVQVYRYRHASTLVERQQTKWTAFAAGIVVLVTISATAIVIIDPTLSIGSTPSYRSVVFELVNDTVQTLAFMLVPLALLVAIMRYRLWDIDIIINRTLVYVPLTGILAGLYAATVAIFQRVFLAITGQQSDAAVIVTTLIVASLFTPIKNALQALVDRRFKEARNPAKSLTAFGDHLQSVIEVFDVDRITNRALEEAVHAFGAVGGSIYLLKSDTEDGPPSLAHTYGEWNDGNSALSMPIVSRADGTPNGKILGSLQLGPRSVGIDYTEKDRELLEQSTSTLAETIALARRVTPDRP
jgi:hypothetical protein